MQPTRPQQHDAPPTGGVSEQSCPARQPGRLVVIDAQPPCEQQQQQAPWQQQGPQINSVQPGQQVRVGAQQQHHQQWQDQQQPEAAPAQLPAQLQQQQWHATLPVPHSPVKSPRKHPAGRRWALLQKLKAVNRGSAAAAGARPDRPEAAAQLVAQLQQLIQGPLGAAQEPSVAATSGNDGWKPDLDAAAAMALHHVTSAQQASSCSNDQQQHEGGDSAAPCCTQQDRGQLCTQPSLHSAAAQTSKVLLHVPDAVAAAAAVTDAAVQAASATAEAGTGSEQQQDVREQGALELAQLILNAFDRSGGVILPEAGQSCGHPADAMQPSQQGGASWGLLPNPFAGAAAPQFQSVEDRPQCSPPGVEPSQASSGPGDDSYGQEVSMQQCGLLYEQGQESSQQQQLGGGSGKGTTQHGCCFAACPRHISSLELGASAQPQQQRVTRHTTGAKQPARAAAGRGSCGAPSLARSSRAKGSSSSTRRQSSQQAGASGPQGDATHSQPRQQQQRRTSSLSSSGGQAVLGSSRAPVSPNTWASEQTKQLDELWQHWHRQQAKAQAAGGAAQDSTQQLLDKEQRQELEAAYARASAARSSAKAAAQNAAASRSQRLRAELADLGRMLAEVDTLAAQMEVESGQAAAAVQQFEAELGARGVFC